MTSTGALRSARAARSPPKPAPTMTTVGRPAAGRLARPACWPSVAADCVDVDTSVMGRTEPPGLSMDRSEEHTSELQSHSDLVCRLLLEKKKRHRGQRREQPGSEARQRERRRA